MRTVRLEVLVEPSVQGVIGPKERIDYIVLVLAVGRALRLLCSHRPPEHVSEIKSGTGCMILYLI